MKRQKQPLGTPGWQLKQDVLCNSKANEKVRQQTTKVSTKPCIVTNIRPLVDGH